MVMGYERLLRRWIGYGVMAPSHLNRQPWRIRVTDGPGVEIGLDPARMRDRNLDHIGREDLAALGSLSEYLVISAPPLGYGTELKFSSGRDESGPRVVLTLSPLAELPEPDVLFTCMATRDEHGGWYGPQPLDEVRRDRLRAAVTDLSEVSLTLVEGEAAGSLGGVLHEAGLGAENDPVRLGEVAAYLRVDERSGDGIPHAHAGLSKWQHLKLLWRERFNPWEARRDAAHRYLTLLGRRKAPSYMMLTSSQDEQSLFTCGRAAARLYLTAAHLERASQGQSALLDGPDSGKALASAAGLKRGKEVRWVARLGVPVFRTWPRTPRRPVESFLV